MKEKDLQQLSDSELAAVAGGGFGSVQEKELFACKDSQSATACLRKYGIRPGTPMYNEYMKRWSAQN